MSNVICYDPLAKSYVELRIKLQQNYNKGIVSDGTNLFVMEC